MKSFEIKITGNAKSLVDSIKSSQSAMDALIKGIDKADKKLEVLTQTGSHLSDIDKQLVKLKTDYPDIFEKIFPNIDSQINESMKPILQMPELVEQTMTKVAQKMKAIDSGTLKATDDDIKELGNDMRILGETLHLENLDMSFLDGTAKAETKIKRLIDTMGKLVEAYFNVNRAAANVNMGEVVTKKKEPKKSKNKDKPELTVDALRKKVEEIKDLSKKSFDDDEAFDLMDNKIQSLIKMFKVSDDIAAKLDEELQSVDNSIEETMSKLEKLLGNQFPKAMGNAADAADDVGKKIQKLLPTSEGLEKLRIVPDGDQKAKISEYAEEYRVILKLLQQGNIESKETISALRERARTLKNIIKGVNPGDTTLDKLLTDGYGISKGTANTVASVKLASKFKIDEFKSENISNDARQEAIDLIYHEISAENQLARKKEEAVLSYDRLTKAVERYYELQSKLDSVTDSDEFDKIADEADKIVDEFTEMNNASSGVFDAIQDGLGKDEALKQLADIFGIKIPEATQKAESGIKDVTSALSETSDGLAKIMYHRGNLLDSKGEKRDNFGQMPFNLTGAVEGDEKWGSIGFGIFGGGLFGVANPSMINGNSSKLNGSTFIQSIDLSKYNMYMADTEERAANLAKFMSQLQKFAMKREVPDFTGFDTELSGVSEESLYKQFQGVFDATDMTKEKFLAFISEMRGLLQEAGIEFDKDLNELTFKNKDSSILSSDNISTRLLKQLGYQGVYTGETSYGDFGQGSVLFDFDVTDIIGYFNTVEQATQDFQNSLKNGWTGSNEQLQRYLSNIEEISARIEAAKAKQLSFNPDFDVSEYDNTLNALNSVKENIQKVLSGESITTDSGKISGEFKTITSSAQETTSAVEGTGTAIENTGTTGSSLEGLNDGVEKAKKTLEEFKSLQDEIIGKGAAAEGGSMDGEAIGRYTERVETAKAKLDELAKQSLLTANQIKEANDIYETAIGNLESKSRTNNEHYDNLTQNTGREPAGSYDSGWNAGYDANASENASLIESLNDEIAKLKAQLNKAQSNTDSGVSIDASAELQNLEKLRAKLEEVKNAIIAKNKAFNDEGIIVGQVVGKEVNAFTTLLTRIDEVSNAITQLINNINSSSEISTGLSNININVNGKVGEEPSYADISSITSAIKEAIYSKDITKAGYTKLTDFNQAFDIEYRDTGDIQHIMSKLNGEIFDTLEEAMAEFNRAYKDLFINKNDSWDILSKEDLFSKIENNSNSDDWAKVVVDAINTQGNNIVQALKIIPSQNASDTKSEAELIKAFQIVANSVTSNTDNYGFKPRDFFQSIIDGSVTIEQDLAQAMQILGMLSNDLKATFVLADTGVNNLGVAIAENIVVPSRRAFLDETDKLAPLLDQAVDLGAAVPRILSSFNDGEKVMELQTRMSGTNLRSSKFNPEDLMNATDKQIDGLLNTLEALSKVGLLPDFTGDNILFDKNKGFSLVDVETKIGKGWMPDNANTFGGMVDYLVDYINRLTSDSPYDGSKATLSKEQANFFNSRLTQRAALAPEDRLVNFDTIKAQNEVQEGEGVNVKITPIMDEGAIAQVVAENVANTPVTVKINPEIDNQDSTDKDNQILQQKATDDSIGNFEGALDSTTGAINDKTQAFENELETVQRVIPQEIQELDNLLNKINDVTGAVNAKTEAFQTEGNVVSESAKQTAKPKEDNKASNTPTPTKKATASQKESFNDLLRLQKKYYGAQEALENASTSKKKSAIRKNRDELKKQYEEQLKNAKLTAEQQAKLDEKTEDHNRKIAVIRANNEDKADKNTNAQNEKQVNEIYQRREDIISEIIKRQKELNSVTTEEGKAAAEDALNVATDKLHQINEEIDNSGLIFDDKKLSAQNDKLANSIANANKSNFIKEQESVGKEKIVQQKKDFEELLALQKKYYDTQKALEKGIGTVKEEELVRKAAEAEDLYNKKKQEVKLTQEQENQLLEKQAELERELAGVKTDKETTSAAVTAKAKQDGILNAIKQEVSKSYKSTGISVLDEVPEELANTKVAYDALIDKINDYKSKGVTLSDDIIKGLKEEARAIKVVMDAYAEKTKQQAKSDAKQNSENQKPAYKNSIMNSLRKKYFQSYGVATSEEFAISPSVISAAEKLKSAWEELNRLNKEIGNTKPTEVQEIAFSRLTDEFNQAKKELDGIISSTRKLSEKSLGTFDLFDAEGKSEFDLTDTEDRKRALLEAVNTLSEGKAKIGEFDTAYKELNYTVKNADGNWVDMKASINAAGTAIEVVAGKTKSNTSAIGQFVDQLKDKFKSIAQYLISMAGYQEIVQQVRKGIQYVKEIDSALTELKKVTDETDATYAQFLNTMSKTGAEVGATVQDLTNMAANWARLGYNIEEAGELAKSTAVLLNVSEFTDADTASEALISTMQAYGYAAEDSMHVVDVLNEIGNNFAISSDGIATALQDSASSLMAAGNNLEQSVAMIAAANKVLQDPNSVGSALRTISLRIRGTSTKVLEELGEETDGVIESVSKLQAKVKGLSGVDILTDTGAYKDTYTIIKEIGQVWDDMNDINRAALLELLAGKNRSNAMAALLTNMEDLEGAYEDAIAAQGSAEAENEKYMNSIQGRIDQFTNALQTMWKNAIDSDFVKFIVSIGTALVKVVNWLGMIPTILGTIAGAMSAIKGQNLFVDLTGNGKSGVITELIQKVKEGIPAIKEFNSIQGVDNQAKFLNSLKETNPELSDYITKIMTASSVTTENGVATNIASASQSGYIRSLVAAKVASIGLKVATVALNAALTIGVSLLISGAISAISKAINGVKEAKEETKKLTEELKQQQSEIKSNISSLESLKNEFDKLSKGVDEYGNNISLSTEEYSKYKSIIEQIIGYTPTLISGYDEEGNAIANKNNLIEKSIELLKEERKQKLLDLVTDDKLKVAYNASKENYDKAEERFKNINMPSTLAYSGVKVDDNGEEHSGYVNQIDKYIEDVIGIEKNASESISEYIARNYEAVRKNIGKIIERSGQTKDGWKGLNDKQQTELLSYLNNVLSGVREMDASWNSFIQTLQLVPQTSAYYDKLSDSQKSFIASYINGIDDLENKTEEEVSSIKNEILSLTNAIGSDEEAQSLIDQLFSIDSNLSAKEYSDKISEIFNKLVEKGTISNDDKQKFIEQLFPDLKDIETIQEDVKKKIKDGQQDLVNSLNTQDLKIAYSIDASNISFDELKKKIQDVKVANIGDFNISDYSDSISSLSENIGVLQSALEKLNSGSFTMDDYVKLIKDFPKLAKGVDVSSKSFKGLTSNLVREIKASPKSMVKDLKVLKLQLMQTGRSTSDIDQLIYSLEHMPENALDSMITKYSTLADTITEATEAQNELKAAMEENPNEGFETRGEAMDYMKEAMSRGEIGSESNLWNVAEKYGFTFDSAKSINENADALAKFIATREKWFKQDDDGNYTYEGTEDFIKKVDAAVASMPELQELMKWDYNESTGVLDFDFKNKDWDQIVKYLSTCEGLIGLTSDEWADMLVQVGQYFNIDWSNYNDELEYLKKITTEDTDNKTKVEKYGSAMQEYFGKDSSIDLANRPMISSSKMRAKGWEVEDGSYSTVDSAAYSNEAGTAAITVTPILPDGEVLTKEELTKYATEIVNGADPATYEFEVNGKTYTGEDIILAKHNGKDPVQEAKEYGQALHEAQEEYDKLKDTLNINTTIDEKGINGLSEIKEIQSAIQKNADGTTVIDEQAFRKALTSAEYTETQIDLIIDKIKTLNKDAFTSDTFNIGKILDKETGSGIDGLLEIKELQDAIKKDANTGFTVLDTDMFTSVLSEAGYTKTQIDELIQKIQEYENVVSVAGNTDPLGLNGASLSIDALKASLSTLGVSFDDTLGKWFDGKRDLEINVPDLVSTLKEKGWTEEAIRSYCEQLSQANIEGFNIKVNSQEIDEALAKSDDVPEEKTTNYEVTGEGATTLDGIDNTWTEVTKDKTTNYTIYETTVKEVKDKTKFNLFDPSTWADGSANVSGTANAQGNWGIPEDETSLVGELGPELLVRNGKWTTVGENGAEFTDVKKGDIIFNHKQTEELLKNGHITGRGKAYANGTAYLEGGGTFARYGFSGNGGYTKYDVNNSIVDSFGNAASDISDAADDVSDAADKFEEVFDWFEVLLEEIEDNISLMNAKLENAVGISAKKGIYSEILNTEQFKLQELYEGVKLYSDYANKLLAKVPDQYKAMAQNGAVAITDFLGEANEEVVDSINNYREWAKKVSDLNQQIEETKKNIHDTHVETQNMIKDEYDNRISLITATNDRIQETIDLLDEEGKRSSAIMYEEMIKNSTKQLSELQNKRAEMQDKLDEAVSLGPVNGVEKYSSQWYEMVNAISDVDSEINDCKVALEGFQNSINQLHWDNFEKFIDAIDNVGTEISNLGDLIDEEDVVDEIGNWTKKGITALGLYAQEMERAKYRAEQYGKEIEYLNQEYAAGKYSVDEYNEKLQELKDGQWDSIKSYEAAKKSIIDLNKTRVDAIKDGIQKEIDAYSELIDKKKEELSLQKDAHDFSKQVAEQQKNVADLQKKLAVMAGDNSASAIAQKKKLQAELSAAQQELEELYYNHSVEKQQEALDKSLENYQDNKQNEMDALDESLKNEEQVISDSYATIAANTESVAQTLAEIASQYGITLSDSVTKPWLDGANAIGTYQEQLDTSMSSFTKQLEALKKMYADLQAQADSTGKSMIDAINSNKSKTENSTYTPPQSTQPSTPSQPSKPSAPSAGASVTVKKSATNFSRDGGNGTRMQSWVPGSTFTVYQSTGSEVLIGRNGGYTGWVRLSDIEGYAKGTKGVTNDQLAMLDELGEELVLHAGKDGKLQFLTKGTSVIPSDITENLMKLGSLDPRQVLDNNRPSIGAPHIINNNMEINMEIAEVVHIDHADNSSIPDITKAVQKQMDAYMKNINQGLKRYTR